MRTHWCGEIRTEHVGATVIVAGWVHRRRDHGGVIFIDLRDREGLVQVVFRPDAKSDSYSIAEKLRSEFVVAITGKVIARMEGAANPNLPTGDVEIEAEQIEILSESETPPFPIEDRVDVNEETRLKYRYLDLRRPEMQRVMRLRHRVVSAIRNFFDAEGFIDVETPMLNKSTPEGARDYLVPSRLQPGTFFALTQSPQLFKQLLMISGFDRYYQIVRCFRDEDPRADRQPDFTQLDMEMSFTDEATIKDLAQRMFAVACKQAIGVDIQMPFPEMTYTESMDLYGTDKPDLRFGNAMIDVTKVFAKTDVRVFAKVMEAGGIAKALCVEGAGELGRKELDDLSKVARTFGAGGLAWIVIKEDGITSPLANALSPEEVKGLIKVTSSKPGDLVLIVVDKPVVANRSLGAVRLALADSLNLRPQLADDDPEAWKFLWLTEIPLVEWNEKEERWDSVHHPFTAPDPRDEHLLETDPGAVRARAYDVILNGWEAAGGSIRIHRPDMQRRIFALIGLDEETAERRFGWFLRAFDFGAPPHGGIASGIDRFVALLAGKDSIREAMAFPKTSAMTDAMTSAPDVVDEKQLKELRISVLPPAEHGR
ncbi:MAG: aspartate--tRNA ligase [Actinomycetota bacterium]